MKRQKVDVSTEQKIVTAMVVSKTFLAQALPIIKPELIQARHLQQIAKWCLNYYERYRDAPRENIESVYNTWVDKGKAKDETVDAVYTVLDNLSEDYAAGEELNIPYLLDVAGDYFNLQRITALKDELEYHLMEGDKQAALSSIAGFSTAASTLDMGVDPLNDEEGWDLAFCDLQEPLISWGNRAADFFFGNALVRDGLIGILGPEKRGKTWWCVELVVRAVSQRRRVALFEVGDMSLSQIRRRLGVRLSKRPMLERYLGTIKVPHRIWRDGSGVSTEWRDVECDQVVTPRACKEAVKQLMRRSGVKPKEPHLMFSVHPNSSVNVQDIFATLNHWEAYKGFIPDIILIDYPDILAPEPNTSHLTTRDQTNATWKALRRLSQERHCLVVAPTQADAASLAQDTLTASNFSEDKRKLSHVTGMLGLNQTNTEKDANVMRLNWIVLREGEFNAEACLHVGQCLKLGRAFCCACL